MNPAIILMGIQAIESLTLMVTSLIHDHAAMSTEDKTALLARIKQIQASIPKWE